MNFARLIVLGIAIVTAGAAAFLVRSMSTSQGPANAALEQPVIATSEVLVATRNIGVGEKTISNDFRWQQWPDTALHKSFIVRKGPNQTFADHVGSVMRYPVVEGEPVTGQKMVKSGDGGVMATILEPGMRAVGVKISAETGAGGFILPNDRVDVIMTNKFRDPDSRGDKYTSETILNDVRVLAIDQTFREEDGQQVVVGRTATLELTSGQSETLALAAEMGEVSLALRSLAKVDGESEEDMAKASKKVNGQVAVLRNARRSGS